MLAYLFLQGDFPGPLFLLQNGQPLSRAFLTDWLRQTMSAARFQVTSPVTAFALVQLQWQLGMVFQIILPRLLGVGPATPTSFKSGLHPNIWLACPIL